MNDDAAPLEPDELDELLSADLDADLEAAARERGSDVDTVRARIAATPNAAERRAALSAAREILAQAPELNALDATRLRANAVRAAEAAAAAPHARRERRNRMLLAVSGIAAAILVVAGIAFASSRSSSSSSSDRAASSTPRAVRPKVDLTRPVPALGSYADVRRLGSVALEAAQQRSTVNGPAVAYAGAGGAPTASSTGGSGASSPTAFGEASQAPLTSARDAVGKQRAHGATAPMDGTARKSASASTPPATCAAAKFAGSGDELLLRASATLGGRPVQVYVYEGHGEHTIVVLDARCALVNVQFVS